MLNHFRTLLVNLPGPAAGPSRVEAGDEAVPAGFRPVAPSPEAAAVRAALFGSDPDPFMLRYRARQLLTLVHACELAGYAYALDPRVTYGVGVEADDPFADPAYFLPRVSGPGLAVTGSPSAPDDTGRCSYGFTVDVSAGDLVVTPMDAPASWRSYPLPYDGPVPLPGTGYSALVTADAWPWSVVGVRRPQRDLSEVAARAAALPATLRLFGDDPAEPYRTFRNLWSSHPELPYRLGGLACALVYRAEEARLRRGG